MKMNYIKISVLFAALFVLGACQDFLDREPISVAVDEAFWSNENEVEVAVNGGYSLLRNAMTQASRYFTYGDVTSDQFSNCEWDFNFARQFSLDYSFAASEVWRPQVKHRDWTSFYRVIDWSNSIVEKVPAIPVGNFSNESVKSHLLGEGYFLRAFTYLYITKIWGDVPMSTEVVKDVILATNIPRSPKEEVYELIRSDIDKAIALLSTSYRGKRGIRANKAVAYALKAHFEAWLGNYPETILALDQMDANGTYGYGPRGESDYINRFYSGNTPDNVFFLPRLLEDMENTFESGLDSDIAWVTGATPYHRDRPEPLFAISTSRLNALFEDQDDIRFKYGFQKVDQPRPMIMKYLNFSWENEGDRIGPRYSYVINIYRYTGLRLLKAEALAAVGRNAEALQILNEVREVNEIQPLTNPDDVYQEVMEERARELFLEGHRFFDMVRMARHKQIYKFEFITPADFEGGKSYWPVDPILFNNNPILTQTQFWDSRL
ncbi:RagB/SusD family nutrient uptake outer membrane protein [Belliella marina]|uniref:RagB/SusD family nutrient uptake outer membrane protein n=1 Tax=Belliella marina TaxID=1644146 RepID=A0ABW4VMS4_9BACT